MYFLLCAVKDIHWQDQIPSYNSIVFSIDFRPLQATRVPFLKHFPLTYMRSMVAQTRKGNRKPQTCVSGLSLTNLDNVLTLEMALNLYLYLMNDGQDTVDHMLWLRKSHEMMSGMPFLVRYDSKESRQDHSSSIPMTKFILNHKRSKLKAKINPSFLCNQA